MFLPLLSSLRTTFVVSKAFENSPHTSSSSPHGQSGMPLQTCDVFTQVRLSHEKLPGQGGIRVDPGKQGRHIQRLTLDTECELKKVFPSEVNAPQLSTLSSEASLQCGVPSQSCWWCTHWSPLRQDTLPGPQRVAHCCSSLPSKQSVSPSQRHARGTHCPPVAQPNSYDLQAAGGIHSALAE